MNFEVSNCDGLEYNLVDFFVKKLQLNGNCTCRDVYRIFLCGGKLS